MDNLKEHQDFITANVEQILKNDIHSRSDDFYLCALYIKNYAHSNHISSESFNTFIRVLRNYKEHQLPNLFSIRRARQDIQKKHPELRAPNNERKRIEAEQEYRDYYSKYKGNSNND